MAIRSIGHHIIYPTLTLLAPIGVDYLVTRIFQTFLSRQKTEIVAGISGSVVQSTILFSHASKKIKFSMFLLYCIYKVVPTCFFYPSFWIMKEQELKADEWFEKWKTSVEPAQHPALRQACDTLIVWKTLASAIGQSFVLSNLKGSEALARAETFLAWTNQHQQQLAQVRKLDLNWKHLQTIPSLETLINLEHLLLSYNRLTCLPPSIARLSKLKVLSLEHSGIAYLPPQIGQLSNLQTLNLENNAIATLPPEFGQLTQLKTLNIKQNKLRDFPPSIRRLRNLEKLELSNNQLRSFPSPLNELTQLQELALNGNFIPSIPRSIGRELPQLQALELSNNNIEEVPAELGQLVQLRRLWLGNNQLEHLPIEIGNLKGLWNLDLSFNHLIDLPEEIGHLSKLIIFQLFSNQLSSLPLSLAHLSKCIPLNAQANRFTEETIREFQAHLAAVKKQNPEHQFSVTMSCYQEELDLQSPYTQKLTSWLNDFEMAKKPISSCKELFYPQLKRYLGPFLDKLKLTEDYQSGEKGKKQIIFRTGQMLLQASSNKTFRAKLILLLKEAADTCPDGAVYILNKVELLWHLSQAENWSAIDLAHLLIGFRKIELLDKYAQERALQWGLDEAEVLLLYHITFKDKFKLPLSTERMRYPLTVEKITPAMLDEDGSKVLSQVATPEQVVEILLSYDVWEEKISSLFPKDWELEKAQAAEQISNLLFSKEGPPEGNTLKQINLLKKRPMQALTSRWVSEQPAFS